MSAALAHVLRNVDDSAAQWEKAVCSLASMSHLELAQTQLHLLRTFSQPSWARLAVVESQCHVLVQQALMEVQTRRAVETAARPLARKPDEMAPSYETTPAETPHTSEPPTPPSVRVSPRDMSKIRELIAHLKEKGKSSQEALTELMGAPRNMHRARSPELNAIAIDPDELESILDRVRVHHAVVRRSAETPVETAKRLYFEPGFKALKNLEGANFIAAANKQSSGEQHNNAQEEMQRIYRTVSQTRETEMSLDEVKLLVIRLLIYHNVSELAAADEDAMRRMIADLPAPGAPLAPRYDEHEAKPSKQIRTNKEDLAPPSPSSTSMSLHSPGSTASVFSMQSARGGDGYASDQYV